MQSQDLLVGQVLIDAHVEWRWHSVDIVQVGVIATRVEFIEDVHYH